MKHVHLTTLLSYRILLIGTLLLTGASGCSVGSVDSTDALTALSDCRDRLELHEQQQAALAVELTETIADVATERLRLTLLLDIDELSVPDGEFDRALIQRLLQDGSENAVVDEVRLGRLSIEQAIQLVSDATASRQLSPELRAVAEERIVERFSSWQRLVATRRTLLSRLNNHHAAAARMLNEMAQLTDAIRSASSQPRQQPIRVGDLMLQATDFIEDPELRDSTRSLIDLLLNPAGTVSKSTARSQN